MKNYLSLVKFSHTIFALPFAMIGFTLGCFWLSETEISKDTFIQEISFKLLLVLTVNFLIAAVRKFF